jgi:hypothetical protein
MRRVLLGWCLVLTAVALSACGGGGGSTSASSGGGGGGGAAITSSSITLPSSVQVVSAN